MMRVAIAGKGGTGKTTIAATLARTLARRGRRVLAIDADTNPNLGVMLGLSGKETSAITTLPRNLIEQRTGADGTQRSVFIADPNDIVREFATVAPDGIELLVMGRVDHAGAG